MVPHEPAPHAPVAQLKDIDMLKTITGLLAVAAVSFAALPASANMMMHDRDDMKPHKVQVCKTVWVKNTYNNHHHKVTICKWVWVK